MRYTFIYGNVNFLILFIDLKFAYNLLFGDIRNGSEDGGEALKENTGRNHMFPYFWNVAETCNSMFPLCLRKSGPVPLYTQQRKREKTSRNR